MAPVHRRGLFPDAEPAGNIRRLTEGEAGAGANPMSMSFSRDVVIVGGCGRVGLPLGLVLADAGLSVTLYDVDANAVDHVRAGKMPFWERDADDLLERMIATDRLDATIDAKAVSEAEHVVLVVG